LFILDRFFLTPQEVSVIPRPACDFATVDFEYARREFLQKCPIVGNKYHGARVRVDLVFEPLDRRNIEMIGRLVEQQQVGFLYERLRQGNRFFNALFDMPAIMRVDLGVQRLKCHQAVLVELELRLFLVGLEQLLDVSEARPDDVADWLIHRLG